MEEGHGDASHVGAQGKPISDDVLFSTEPSWSCSFLSFATKWAVPDETPGGVQYDVLDVTLDNNIILDGILTEATFVLMTGTLWKISGGPGMHGERWIEDPRRGNGKKNMHFMADMRGSFQSTNKRSVYDQSLTLVLIFSNWDGAAGAIDR
jgi:hypothetical protein